MQCFDNNGRRATWRGDEEVQESESIGCDLCGITEGGRAGQGSLAGPARARPRLLGCDANEGEEIINPDSVFIIRASPRDDVYPGGGTRSPLIHRH